MRRFTVATLSILLAACSAGDVVPRAQSAPSQPAVAPRPAPTPTPTGPATFVVDGQLTQGGFIRGQVPGGTRSATLDEQPLAIAPDGRFLAAFDRDAGLVATLVARLADGREIRRELAVAPRAWQIEPADALAAWLWGWLENQLAVLMKTLPLGQQAAQRLTSHLLPLLDQAQRQASEIEPQHWGSAAFGLALASMAHERQYSRLFRS
mgnify:CR=1 FL=1